MYITDNDIQIAVKRFSDTYQVKQELFEKLIGMEHMSLIRYQIEQVNQEPFTCKKLLETIIRIKGPSLLSGSSEEVREIRRALLRKLPENELRSLYERNAIKGKNIQSVSYMPRALAQKQWKAGGKWPRDFIKTVGLPLCFSGFGLAKEESVPTIMDIEARKAVPPLAPYQLLIKEEMTSILSLEDDATRCIVSLPTGGGKTRVAVESFIDWMQPRFAEGRYMLWIAQSEELCEQAIACIADMWQEREFPESLRIYRYFGTHNIKPEDLIGGVVVASIQKIVRRLKNDENDEALDDILQLCGAMIVDEAHHAAAHSYQLLFERAREMTNGRLFAICGLTATPGRSGDETALLVNQFEARLLRPRFPDQRDYDEKPLKYFRDRGYLAKPIYRLMKDQRMMVVEEDKLDESGDLSTDMLRVLASDEARNQWIINTLLDVPSGSSTLVYACTVEHAEMLSMLINTAGRTAAVIAADTPKGLRRSMIEAFRKGQIEFLFNYGVLTTGFDAPKVDHLFLLRPTASEILYEQMVGRGLRGPLFGGTETCMIYDFSGNVTVHGQPLAYARFLEKWDISYKEERGGQPAANSV